MELLTKFWHLISFKSGRLYFISWHIPVATHQCRPLNCLSAICSLNACLSTCYCTFNSRPISHLTTCPHADPLTALTMTQPYVFPDPCMACPVTAAVPLWWRCWWGLPSPSTCLSKISAGSFLCPLILDFKTTKGQAADRKNGHESPRGARHAKHTPDPMCQAQSCHDIIVSHSKNKIFLGLAIVGLRFDGWYPGGWRDLFLHPQVHRFDPLQQPMSPYLSQCPWARHWISCCSEGTTPGWTLVLLPLKYGVSAVSSADGLLVLKMCFKCVKNTVLILVGLSVRSLHVYPEFSRASLYSVDGLDTGLD